MASRRICRRGGMCQYYCLFLWLREPNGRRCAPWSSCFCA
ncbi:hypothetical protein GMOD_00004130 [Pyrenophora seminiperda CCB06]|uniref:Uncharacterized protein n=1 Tax=Pyrenophora seminiperda CCB06 TaxID=1302712 RepID=A0A3M7M0P6_9PLEO|nr:hypothetical protein GMOD_00004130 [Pyrenophora seminiperda CCB06]